MDGTQRTYCGGDRIFVGLDRRPGAGSLRPPDGPRSRGCGMTPIARRTLLKRIEGLNDLASNLWWSWNRGAREVFRCLDYPLWRRTHHNPLEMLNLVTTERFDEVVQ